VHLLVVAALGLATTALFFDAGGNMVEALGKDPSLTGRTQIWGMVLAMHTNPWIGTGFESFWLGPRLNQMRNALPNFPINEAHNGYLEIYLNLGWAGICFIALLLATAYKRVISGMRRDPAKASVFLGFLLCTLFYSSLSSQPARKPLFSEADRRPDWLTQARSRPTISRRMPRKAPAWSLTE
jgi:O-antigen ligase